MAKFDSLPMIIGILIYYVAFFIAITVISSGFSSVRGLRDPDTSFSGSGITGLSSPFDMVSPSGYQCGGKTDIYKCVDLCILSPKAVYIDCRDMKDAVRCNDFNNCDWTNSSGWLSWLTDGKCDAVVSDSNYSSSGSHAVNMSYYGFPLSDRAFLNTSTLYTNTTDICSVGASGLDSRTSCEKFGCVWLNLTDIGAGEAGKTGFSSTIKPGSIIENIGWVITFKFDFGLSFLWNTVLSFFCFYVPLLALAMAIYYMFVPM